jgi:hypothetical protein
MKDHYSCAKKIVEKWVDFLIEKGAIHGDLGYVEELKTIIMDQLQKESDELKEFNENQKTKV